MSLNPESEAKQYPEIRSIGVFHGSLGEESVGVVILYKPSHYRFVPRVDGPANLCG